MYYATKYLFIELKILCILCILSHLENQPDVICIIESWFSINDVGCHIPGYNFYSCPRGSRDGGIALYVKVNIDVRNNINFVPERCELVLMSLRIPGANYSISLLGVYRPLTLTTNADKQQFLSELEQLLNCVPHGLDDRIIVSSDCNINLLYKDQFSC